MTPERHDRRTSDATESELLLDFLEEQRRHVLGILEGLSEELAAHPGVNSTTGTSIDPLGLR
jgi:hypothetical protein